MKKAFLKSRFYVGVSLLIQSVTMVVLFFSQWKKRKSLAAAFISVAAISGAVGGYLVASGAKDEAEKNEMLEALREDFFEISDDDIADEEDAIFCTNDSDDEITVDTEIEVEGENE